MFYTYYVLYSFFIFFYSLENGDYVVVYLCSQSTTVAVFYLCSQFTIVAVYYHWDDYSWGVLTTVVLYICAILLFFYFFYSLENGDYVVVYLCSQSTTVAAFYLCSQFTTVAVYYHWENYPWGVLTTVVLYRCAILLSPSSKPKHLL